MTDIFPLFTFIGLAGIAFLLIVGVTWLIGWVAGDDEGWMRWMVTALAFAACLAIFVLKGA